MARWSLAAAALLVGGVAGVFLAGPLLQGQPVAVTNVPKELTSYRDIVKKVLPAVVMIESKAATPVLKKSGGRRQMPFDDRHLPPELRRFFKDFNFDFPEPQQFGDDDDDGDGSPYLGLGSGFVVDPKGVILTNYHVVEGASEVVVNFKDGRKLTSKDIKTDPKTDLAIIRIKAESPLPYLEMGDSAAMEIGDRVLAVGAPFGLSGSVTAGIVSAKQRSLHMNMYEDFIQTDAAINPGNSGGPLVNLEGKVIGINSAIKSRTGGFQGVGMAISSNLAKNIMDQLLKNGAVRRGYLGVQIKDVDNPALAKKLGVDNGVMVTQVFPGSPAAKAGVKEGDVIVGLHNKPVREGRELQTVVAGLPLDQPVDLEVVRDGQKKTLEVTVGEQPKDFGVARAPSHRSPKQDEEEGGSVTFEKLGFEVTDLTPELADQLGYKESAHGALITTVDRGSPASEAGLRRGMLVTKVEKHVVKSAADLREHLERASLDKGVLLQVKTPTGGTTYVLLQATAESKK